ncbi:MAG: hypothetical protein A2351_07895 [Omnitrophica bacterium RIFOXYB12_FULL_50_7]|nr:MAG: hypothetical protein A2351_07895 [Omnitrophica bacterium RIFOXYB12_FULL_50_7]
MPLDRSACPSVAGLTRALGFARPGDFARSSSRSASSLVPAMAGSKRESAGGRHRWSDEPPMAEAKSPGHHAPACRQAGAPPREHRSAYGFLLQPARSYGHAPSYILLLHFFLRNVLKCPPYEKTRSQNQSRDL